MPLVIHLLTGLTCFRFAYYMVILRVTQGLRFGLGIKHYRNMVIVSKVEEGSTQAMSSHIEIGREHMLINLAL